jgi:hypothetical protein
MAGSSNSADSADPSPSPRPPERDRAFTSFFTVLAVGIACAITLLAVPKAVAPVQLPPLRLDSAAVASVLETDRVLAAQAPTSARIQELESLFAAEGQAELKGSAGAEGTAQRRRRLALYSAQLASELGDKGFNALRARATERGMAALSGRDSGPSALGSFPELLERYGLRDAEGHWRAPPLAVRAAFKVRWNMIHERALTEGLTPVELHAYHGWMALHAGALSPQSRATAAAKFHETGGKRSGEAYAIWLFQGGEVEQATQLMERAYLQSGELRQRNMALYMRATASH